MQIWLIVQEIVIFQSATEIIISLLLFLDYNYIYVNTSDYILKTGDFYLCHGIYRQSSHLTVFIGAVCKEMNCFMTFTILYNK